MSDCNSRDGANIQRQSFAPRMQHPTPETFFVVHVLRKKWEGGGINHLPPSQLPTCCFIQLWKNAIYVSLPASIPFVGLQVYIYIYVCVCVSVYMCVCIHPIYIYIPHYAINVNKAIRSTIPSFSLNEWYQKNMGG